MIQRKILPALIKHLSRDEFSVLIGARQTGKTTLLKQLEQYLENQNLKSYFISLEDFDILKELNKHPENLMKFLSLKIDSRIFVLLDEIQYLDDPTNFLKYLFDKYSSMIKIICTGSSAFYIDEKFKDSLVGRKKIFELQVLDFDEFLLMKGRESLIIEKNRISSAENYISLYRNELNVLLDEYLTFGAYPAVVKANETDVKMDILKDLFQSYLKKDIFEAGVKQQEKFYQLMKVLAHQSGSLLNMNELSNTLGISTSAVSNYINVLQKTFHVGLIRPFYGNIRKELTKMPKLYFSDLGLRNTIVNIYQSVSGRSDKGGLFENLMYGALAQKYQKDSLKYWRTAEGNEVDFVIDDASGRFAIEVKFSQKEFKPSKYSKFKNAYPAIPIQCVSYHSDTNQESVWRWL
jgi:uncharacterized protein